MDRRFGWAVAFAAVLGALAAGVVSYNAGVSHGLAMSPALANVPAGMVVPYGWYRPWGFGFGLGPLFLVLFWFVAFRMLFRGSGGFRGRRWQAGDHPRVPPAFEDWHRRAHERMAGQPPSPQS